MESVCVCWELIGTVRGGVDVGLSGCRGMNIVCG